MNFRGLLNIVGLTFFFKVLKYVLNNLALKRNEQKT